MKRAPLEAGLVLPADLIPAGDAGIGDAERSRRLTEVLDQIEDEQAREVHAAALRSTA